MDQRSCPPPPATKSRRGGYGWGAVKIGAYAVALAPASSRDEANGHRSRSGTAPHPYLPATSWGEGVPGADALITERARPRALRARKERPRINGPALMSPSPRDEVAAGRVRVGGGQDRRVCGRACAGIVSRRGQWSSFSKRHSPHPYPPRHFVGGGGPRRGRVISRERPMEAANTCSPGRVTARHFGLAKWWEVLFPREERGSKECYRSFT